MPCVNQFLFSHTECVVDTVGPRDMVTDGATGSIREGESVSLTCSAKGNPPPTISWFKEESRQSTGPEWSIEDIQEAQSGQYHCEAENKHGTLRSNPVNITVTCE